MGDYVIDLDQLDRTRTAVAGGKGALLGELARVDGVCVPAGFCVTTDAFREALAHATSIDDVLEELSSLAPDDREAIHTMSAEIRRRVCDIGVPENVAAAIARALAQLGEQAPFAVRSSATAEDSPTASFAGQHDTYLNVIGTEAILAHVISCWTSLFSERAVAYRLRIGLDHRGVGMAVVVQRMVLAEAAGTLFTADPVSSNRKLAFVEASFGLGEAFVSGRANADIYTVRDGKILSKTIAPKQLTTQPAPSGGTRQQPLEPERWTQPALTDAQVVRLVQLGRRIEAHLGHPQDIEWCMVEDRFAVVQSRPITTLFPIPAAGDGKPHVYVSVAHQQMMTDPMSPLGVSVWQMTAARAMHEAGGRLFVDITQGLASPAARATLLEVLGRGDPLIRDALETLLERGDFIPSLADAGPVTGPAGRCPVLIDADPSIVEDLIAQSEASLARLKRDIAGRSGAALLEFIREDIQELKRVLFDPRSMQVIMAAMEAAWWLNENVEAWLGEKSVADTLAQSVAHNVTSEMGLALLDVADVIRPHPGVVAFLARADDEDFLDELTTLEGGPEAREAIQAYLERYGMRGVGEIDIARPRWSEHPTALLPLILGNVRNFGAGAGRRRFEHGRAEAERKAQELLARLHGLPDGARKAEETKRMIDRVRTFTGYREYPKYGMVSRYFVYKQALRDEGARLEHRRILADPDDIFYLTFDELQEVVRTEHADGELIRERRRALRSWGALSPPRVLTSDGEVLTGAYRRDDLPGHALAGLPVSAGTVEGRARVVRDIGQADLEPGDILVTAYTDPSWAPVFVTVAGLVTEVGGLMTHGAVIAREYGLPAIVGVSNATELIRDGQHVRLHATEGYIEILA